MDKYQEKLIKKAFINQPLIKEEIEIITDFNFDPLEILEDIDMDYNFFTKKEFIHSLDVYCEDFEEEEKVLKKFRFKAHVMGEKVFKNRKLKKFLTKKVFEKSFFK